jgi:cytochrome oxidase Cu insertion factor (SCO1/SenC/PrrC family)
MTTRKNKFILISLFVLFLGPVFLAVGLHSYGYHFSGGTVNNGQLLMPPITSASLKAEKGNGEPFVFSQLKGKWSMLYVDNGACARVCQKTLYNMRQIRKALGRDQDRVLRVLLASQKKQQPLLTALVSREYKGTELAFNGHLQRLKHDSLYLIDPNGNVMMRYTHDVAPKGILTDLKRLLKLSQIG